MILKVLLSTVLLTSAALGVGAFTGALPFVHHRSMGGEGLGGVVVQEFAKTFDEPITAGDLDLRIDRGKVRVVGWDENAYLVQVLQSEASQSTASDHETIVDFQDASTGPRISLAMTVTREGTYSVDASNGVRLGEDRPETAVVAFVPRTAHYDTVLACSGRDAPLSYGISFPPQPEEQRASCLPADDSPALVGDIHVASSSSGSGLNVTFGADGIHGGALDLFTDFGDIDAYALEFETGRLASEYGGLTVFDARFDQLTATTEYGDVTIKGAIPTLTAGTQYGDVVAQLEAAGDGAIKVASEYGEVSVLVPADPAIGYQAEAGTDYGDIRILLADAEVDEDGSEDEFSFDPSSWFMDEGYDKTASAETDGFANAASQVVIAAFTQYGDVVIADGSHLEHIEEDEEDDDGTASGLADLRVLRL